jgi:purine-cytosine permease-like protein
MIVPDRHFAHVTKSLRTSSAIVPALVLTAICLPIGAIAAAMTPAPLNYIFMATAIIPPIVAILQIAFFTFADRDRLQNEEHVERKMLLSQMRPEFGDATSVIEVDNAHSLMSNPKAKGEDDV